MAFFNIREMLAKPSSVSADDAFTELSKRNEGARQWDRVIDTASRKHGLRLTPDDDAEYQKQYDAAAARRDAAKQRGDQELAKRYRQQISALYAKYEDKQLPEVDDDMTFPILQNGELGVFIDTGVTAEPLPPNGARLNTDRTVAVSADVFWNEDMENCPRGCKVQLLGTGGVAVYGMYDGKDPFWVGWQAVPRRRVKENRPPGRS